MNNPVVRKDTNGLCSWYFGIIKDDCGSLSCPDSVSYDPSAAKVAVIYDANTTGNLGGLWGGEGFCLQGGKLVDAIDGTYYVEAYPCMNAEDFINSWNSLTGEYEAIYIVCHGYAGGLRFGGAGYIKYSSSCSTEGKFGFDLLKPVSADEIYLFCCDGATPTNEGVTVAGVLCNLINGAVYAAANGSINFRYLSYRPYLPDGGNWSKTYKK